MKKNLTVLLAALLMGGTAFGQAIVDRNVIPVAVNLSQVLRMTITSGGNIEFVFNTIDDYNDGITGAAGTDAEMYQTVFTVASSTMWELSYGAEEGTFIGTDDPGHVDLDLNNVGFSISSGGTHAFGTELASVPTTGGTEVAGLEQYPTVLITDGGTAGSPNAGDATDNEFTITWRCGTAEASSTMNTAALIEQSITADRYVANVLFELSAL